MTCSKTGNGPLIATKLCPIAKHGTKLMQWYISEHLTRCSCCWGHTSCILTCSPPWKYMRLLQLQYVQLPRYRTWFTFYHMTRISISIVSAGQSFSPLSLSLESCQRGESSCTTWELLFFLGNIIYVYFLCKCSLFVSFFLLFSSEFQPHISAETDSERLLGRHIHPLHPKLFTPHCESGWAASRMA